MQTHKYTARFRDELGTMEKCPRLHPALKAQHSFGKGDEELEPPINPSLHWDGMGWAGMVAGQADKEQSINFTALSCQRGD